MGAENLFPWIIRTLLPLETCIAATQYVLSSKQSPNSPNDGSKLLPNLTRLDTTVVPMNSSKKLDASHECRTSFSTATSFTVGTGNSIYKNVLLPAILNARSEVVLVTCFWAPSDTLDGLAATLKDLSQKTNSARKIKVYICFSSRSTIQKLFHTSSPNGHVYPESALKHQLGLPAAEELSGLEVSCKSLFFRPFSVLHSKYVIVDRRRVFLPSCNVSWEEWYECCIGFEGLVVQHVFDFWKTVWMPGMISDGLERSEEAHLHTKSFERATEQLLQTDLLPHRHNASLSRALWLLPDHPESTIRTPLNEALLRLITNAESEIIILTPNFTSQPALIAVCCALCRGVNVRLITNRRMMVPEQIATAGTVTEQCLKTLVKEYRQGFSGKWIRRKLALFQQFVVPVAETKSTSKNEFRMEDGRDHSSLPFRTERLGKLYISYFRPPSRAAKTQRGMAANCTKSHIKVTVVDRKAIVLGSGNMDRASWTTSQELGVLVRDTKRDGQHGNVVFEMWKQVEAGLEGCLEEYFKSS